MLLDLLVLLVLMVNLVQEEREAQEDPKEILVPKVLQDLLEAQDPRVLLVQVVPLVPVVMWVPLV